jgi:hypothetical protein
MVQSSGSVILHGSISPDPFAKITNQAPDLGGKKPTDLADSDPEHCYGYLKKYLFFISEDLNGFSSRECPVFE